ncbi:glutathione S-transferase family protein [Aestuariicella sp. G3-2]|uniref:glutathione S-transferase family protein n=1 Tax=Pseudomaricurvus albidus TaxID=2842452 RepID=UPI001C0BA4EE|nr:glutathione S-transferase family protein [Aestuariicella albida]MBU3068241.1 glutathione S-transferase family protein [Aestuariicella albida]
MTESELELYGHPFSAYTWKVLIPLYENATVFTFKEVGPNHPENTATLQSRSPLEKFPLLLDGGRAVFESSIIIEYLQTYHPGKVSFIPSDELSALSVRTLDRFFDLYVMTPTQRVVDDALRPPDQRDRKTVEDSKVFLLKSYSWLEEELRGRDFACGSVFSLADCAAAPSLFYADWVCEIPESHTALRAYRAQLMARPSVRRCIEDARPYRPLFPLGAPDRD